jgi:glutathione S-transferase
MLKLFDYRPCPWARKTRIALLEKGLQWETTWLDLPSGENKKPEYLAVNPVGKVPALIDGSVIVHDSTIINEYLEDKYPQSSLLPADPIMKARARAFEDYSDTYLAPSNSKVVQELRKPENERDRAKIEAGEGELLNHFAFLERELKGRQFFVGTFSLADVSFIPHFSNYERVGCSIPGDFPNLKAWWERVKARSSYNASWPL